jgi:hypothetical protein
MSLIHNERIKLTAAWFNALAAASVVTGFIAPLAAVVFGVQASGVVSIQTFATASVGWFLFGVGLHYIARRVLRRLRQ